MAKSLLWFGFVLRCCPKFMCLVFSLAFLGEEACKKKELRPSEGVLPEDVMEPLAFCLGMYSLPLTQVPITTPCAMKSLPESSL